MKKNHAQMLEEIGEMGGGGAGGHLVWNADKRPDRAVGGSRPAHFHPATRNPAANLAVHPAVVVVVAAAAVAAVSAVPSSPARPGARPDWPVRASSSDSRPVG